jgi:hypothetical protein
VSPQTELAAFFTEHGRCGDLDAGVDGPIVWMECDCGGEDRAEGHGGRGVRAVDARTTVLS